MSKENFMFIFKKLFKKKTKKSKKTESWYNNFHEQKRDKWTTPDEAGAYTEGCYSHAITMSIAKRQH
jgi:hypothetical protein